MDAQRPRLEGGVANQNRSAPVLFREQTAVPDSSMTCCAETRSTKPRGGRGCGEQVRWGGGGSGHQHRTTQLTAWNSQRLVLCPLERWDTKPEGLRDGSDLECGVFKNSLLGEAAKRVRSNSKKKLKQTKRPRIMKEPSDYFFAYINHHAIKICI